MNPNPHNQPDEQDLWHRFRQESQLGDQVKASIDANQLAAYLAGKAAVRDIEQIEQAMNADPELLDAVIALRDLQPAQVLGRDVVVPDAVRQAAKSLVATTAVDADRVLAWSWHQVTRWAAAAVLVLAVSAAGYVTGRDASRDDVWGEPALAAAADVFEGVDDEPSFFLMELAVVGGVR